LYGNTLSLRENFAKTGGCYFLYVLTIGQLSLSSFRGR